MTGAATFGLVIVVAERVLPDYSRGLWLAANMCDDALGAGEYARVQAPLTPALGRQMTAGKSDELLSVESPGSLSAA